YVRSVSSTASLSEEDRVHHNIPSLLDGEEQASFRAHDRWKYLSPRYGYLESLQCFHKTLSSFRKRHLHSPRHVSLSSCSLRVSGRLLSFLYTFLSERKSGKMSGNLFAFLTLYLLQLRRFLLFYSSLTLKSLRSVSQTT